MIGILFFIINDILSIESEIIKKLVNIMYRYINRFINSNRLINVNVNIKIILWY